MPSRACCGSPPTSASELLTLRVRGDFAPDYGAPLELGFDPAHCHLFDSNGQALDKRLQQAA